MFFEKKEKHLWAEHKKNLSSRITEHQLPFANEAEFVIWIYHKFSRLKPTNTSEAVLT